MVSIYVIDGIKKGRLLLLAPKFCNSKIRIDLNMSKIFESLWVERKLSHKKCWSTFLTIQIINFVQLLDELALRTDKASNEIKSVLLIGVYNINYLNNKEKQKLDTIILLTTCPWWFQELQPGTRTVAAVY